MPCVVRMEYRYYEGLLSIPELTFALLFSKLTTRHLVSFDMNKSYRPGILVFVIIVNSVVL